MTNEKKNVPELRFPEFDEEWEEKKLKDISNKGMYGIGASATNFDGENVYVRITDINESTRKLNNDKLTSPNKLDKKYLLNENDVLFARTGASTGKTYIHKHYDIDKNYYFAGFLIKFEFKNNYLANFIFQNTLTKSFENWVSVMSVRSGQPGINSEEYGKLKMMFPRKAEQQKIGDFFSKLDRQIELEEQKLEKLEEQKKGYMQKIFSQELRFKDENGNDYPEWEEKKLFDVVNYLSSKRSSNYYSEDIIHGQYPVYDAVQEISKDTNFDIEEPYISILKDGAGVGRLNLRPGKSSVIGTMGYLLPQNIDINFLFYYLKTMNFNRFVIGSTIPHLYFKDYSKETILIPIDKSEQIKIGSFLIKLDRIIDNKAKKIKVLKQRKKGYLQKMFV